MAHRCFILILFAAIFAAPLAFAQNVSGRGNVDQTLEHSCESQVALVTKNVASIRARIERILACHAQYKVFNGSTCVDAKFPDYRFENHPTDDTQLLLAFEGPEEGQFNRPSYNVRGAKGPKGYDASPNNCAPGYRPAP